MTERELIRDVREQLVKSCNCDEVRVDENSEVCGNCILVGMIDEGLSRIGRQPELDALLKTCNIYMSGEVQEVEDAADEWGIDLALSAMKRLSIIPRDKGMYPIEQYREILADKVRSL
jgi:hypothetical protein